MLDVALAFFFFLSRGTFSFLLCCLLGQLEHAGPAMSDTQPPNCDRRERVARLLLLLMVVAEANLCKYARALFLASCSAVHLVGGGGGIDLGHGLCPYASVGISSRIVCGGSCMDGKKGRQEKCLRSWSRRTSPSATNVTLNINKLRIMQDFCSPAPRVCSSAM